jgi:hypothetical protein
MFNGIEENKIRNKLLALKLIFLSNSNASPQYVEETGNKGNICPEE